MSRRLILFIATIAVVSSLVLIGIHKGNAQNAKRAKRVPLTVLQSSKAPINSEYTKRTVLAPSKDGQSIYSLDTMTGELFIYDRKSKQLRKAADSLSNAEAFTVGPQGDLYLAQSDSTVQIVNSEGRRLKRFPTATAASCLVTTHLSLNQQPARKEMASSLLLSLISPQMAATAMAR